MPATLIPRSSVAPNLERISWIFWDSVTIANGNTATAFTLFRNIATQTKQNSNMRLSASIPAPQIFKIYQICVAGAIVTTPTTPVFVPAANLDPVLTGLFTLTVSNKPMFTAPLFKIPGGGSIYGVVSVSSNAAASLRAAQNGLPSPQHGYRLYKPITITAVENFQVDLNYDVAPNPTTGFQLFVYLEGVLKRGIQ